MSDNDRRSWKRAPWWVAGIGGTGVAAQIGTSFTQLPSWPGVALAVLAVGVGTTQLYSAQKEHNEELDRLNTDRGKFAEEAESLRRARADIPGRLASLTQSLTESSTKPQEQPKFHSQTRP